MKLLLKFATRNRPDKFLKAMDNICDTLTNPDYKIIVSIDSDDFQMVKIASERNLNAEFWINEPAGKIAAINANIPLHGWDWLVNMSDDMSFVVNGWDEIMREKIKSVWPNSLDFFAHFNDGFQGPKLATMSVIGWEYYQRSFYIYAPCYRSLSCDAEEFYKAQVLKRYHYFPDILFRHLHPANTKATKTDSLYAQNETFQKQDTATYFERLNKDFYIPNVGQTPFDRFKGKRT